MSNNGIRSLLPPIDDPEEIREQAKARAAVMDRINATPPVLHAAPDTVVIDNPITFKPSFFERSTPLTKKEIEDKKFKKMMEDEYGEKALEKDVRVKIYKNKKAGKGEYEDFATHDIIIAENMRDRARSQIKAQAKQTDDLMVKAIRNSSTPVKGYVGGATPINVTQKNKKNLPPSKKSNGLDGRIMVDPMHPDGFRYTDVGDLYRRYGDEPERYVQEVMYLYGDGEAPTAGVVKEYNSLDPSSFPMNQTKALKKYEQNLNTLNPQQRKQVEVNRAKSAIGKRTLKTK
jgi:hypothetical protein|tara:strand:- start:32 stop:895 length:864 start_codon:yes stop_codon:yes gene_type:complete